jgi:4-amino-4-deoxy-L-arabinose transferase-like glycosyltransferase
MFRFNSRAAHYALLTAAHLILTLPNLGAHTLWDMDEGVNAEAGREMVESGNWITPHYNYEIRTAKPALLYWLQALSFMAFGVSEWAARFPSVVCGLGSVWVTYELGRKMFTPSTGLVAALVLASFVEFCLISHAATPDPPLILFQMLVFYCYWAGSERDRRWWFVPAGVFAGLAVLTKGPIGVAMPGVVILIHLLWTRRLNKLWDVRLISGALAFLAVAAPWYVMVALDTKGKWLEAFVMKENFDRFQNPADGHRGGFHFHVVSLIVLTVPWCAFLLATFWCAVAVVRNGARPPADAIEATDAPGKYKFLIAWFASYLVFFSIAATKLPNYILPVYPALAILIARLLERWRLGLVAIPTWLRIATWLGALSIGIILSLSLLFVGGLVSSPIPIKGFDPLPALGNYVWLGIIPILTTLAFGWLAVQGRRDDAVTAYAFGSVFFLAVVAAFPTVAMNEYKCPKHFADEIPLKQTDKDIRIAACLWFRHSLVFYAERRVEDIDDFDQVDQFLALPRPAYVCLPNDVWPKLSAKLSTPVTVVGKHYDFYARREILVIANEYATRK